MNTNKFNRDFQKLNQFIKQNLPLFQKKIDLHLIIDNFPREFNYWRNIGRIFSKTILILLIDIDR